MLTWDESLKFAPVLVSTLILIVALISYYKNRKIKSISYNILTNTEIAPIETGMSVKLKIFYEESVNKLISIADSRLLIIKFINSGNTPIETADFEEGISILHVVNSQSLPF